MNEFDIIQQFFASQPCHRSDVILGIGDDAAIIAPPLGQEIVVCTDTLIENVHFPENTPADAVGFKSLAVNLSDLAAMGATPAWATLAISMPVANESWLKKFSEGFYKLASQYQVQLIGGDTTRGALSITVQAMGFIPSKQAIRRSTAKPGDLIYVTHTVGDATLALQFLQQKVSIPTEYQTELVNKLYYPQPQVTIGLQLRGLASAAIDISDGLIADLTHILSSSQVGAKINVDQLPLSNALLKSTTKEQAIQLALAGGDDYELCFTVPPENKTSVPEHCTLIGEITHTKQLELAQNDGSPYHLTTDGYLHF